VEISVEDRSGYHRNTPEGVMLKSLNEYKVGGLRDTAPPSKVRVYKVNKDGSKGKLIRVEQSDTFEHLKEMNSFKWGHLGHMSESTGGMKSNG
jgi:hypothetical protein